MAHLSLGVAGPFQVLMDDKPINNFESDKVRALLAYLAVESDRPHRREVLVGLLWPEYPEEAARHNLRQAIFNLRRVIGDEKATPPYLLVSRDAIQFNRASDHSLDLDQFNQATLSLDKNSTQNPEAGSMHAAQLEEGVKLYRGEFLEQFFLEDSTEFEEWTLTQRENLRHRVLKIHSFLAKYYEGQGNFREAQRHALRQLEMDPWEEEAHRQMMRVLDLDGQRNAALAQYETCRRVLAEELDIEPSAKTRELYEQIRLGTLSIKTDQVSKALSTPVNNMPVQLTPFIGRELELAQLGGLIANPDCRCITLTGTGGTGKTRLALQAAGNALNRFAHGAAFVPLASVGSLSAIIPDIANGINFAFFGQLDPKVQLLNYLADKEILLILDSVEQLSNEGSPKENIEDLLIELIQQAPGVKLLVTSREALNLQGQWLIEIQGLAFPEDEHAEKSEKYDAVALFVQRARRANPGFALNEENRNAIHRICRLVEGMPLAIELAATWVRTLSPAEIAKEIEGSLDFLSASVRDLPERHRSMRAVFDYSWQMLPTHEQEVLCKLSVFRGGYPRQAAEQVAGATVSILSKLVNQTLLRRTAAGRYELHELVRQYCAAHLATDPQAQTKAEERHYDFYLSQAEAAEQGLKGRSQMEWLGWLEQEHDNLREALEWALERDGTVAGGDEMAMRLSGTLRWFWRMRGHFHEGCEWLMKALRRSPDSHTSARASALLGMSLLMNGLGDLSAALEPAEESAVIYRESGDQQGLAEALMIAGLTLLWQGEATSGHARTREALAIYRKAGDRWGEAHALYRLGSYLADYRGDMSGRAMLEESALILEDLGEKYLFTSVLISLGIVDMGSGDYSAARSRFERSLAVAREIRHPWGIADALTNLGCVFRINGEYATAQSQFEEALQVYKEHGRSIWETDVLCALTENDIAQEDFSIAHHHLKAASDLPGLSENKWMKVLVSYFRGQLAYYEGNAEQAALLLEETTALAREGEFKPDLARSLVSLGRVRLIQGKGVQANELLREGLNLFQKIGHKLGVAITLEALAFASVAQGDHSQAVTLFSTANSLRQAMNAPLPPVDRTAYDSAVAACSGPLGEVAFADAWARTAARPFFEVIEEISKEGEPKVKRRIPNKS